MTPDQYSRRLYSNAELREVLFRSEDHWGWHLARFLLLTLASLALYFG